VPQCHRWSRSSRQPHVEANCRQRVRSGQPRSNVHARLGSSVRPNFAFTPLLVLLAACNATAEAAVTGAQASKFTAAAPLCGASDPRTHVPVWPTELDKARKLSSEPPMQNGRIYFIQFNADTGMAEDNCLRTKPDHVFYFNYPAKGGQPGGIEMS